MSVKTEVFGITENGKQVDKITIKGKGELELVMINYGATITSINFAGKDLALGYDNLQDYTRKCNYYGATIGRYGNRIADSKFVLNGVEYNISANEGKVSLHGGKDAFNSYIWNYKQTGDSAVTFSIVDPDGKNGFPGELKVDVTYAVDDENGIQITYDAVSDKDTILNMTNHTYFNLNGFDNGDIKDNVLTLRGDYFTPIGAGLITTGELVPVEGTPFDFRTAKPIGKDFAADYPQLIKTHGYDHNYVIGEKGVMKNFASAYSTKTGIHMECYTDQPGVQLYTGQSSSEDRGKAGINIYPCQGFCLETQHYPDTPNKPNFPQCTLKAGEKYHTVTKYVFSK